MPFKFLIKNTYHFSRGRFCQKHTRHLYTTEKIKVRKRLDKGDH